MINEVIPKTLPMDHAHADLMEDFIRHAEGKGYDLLGVEIPWSHYGNRGVLDAAFRSKRLVNGKRVLILAEFKSTLADIGRSVRQVQLVKSYFLNGVDCSEYLIDGEACIIECPLIVKATEENLSLVLKYQHLLRDIDILFFDPSPDRIRHIQVKFNEQMAIWKIVDGALQALRAGRF